MAETQSIAPIGADVSESGGSSVFEHGRVVTQHDGIHEASVGSSLVISRDPRFVGTGFFAGEAPDGLTTVYGDPIPADVFVYWRDPDDPMAQEVLVGATKSAPDGTWRITGLNYNLRYVVRARAQGYNDTTVVGAMPSRADVIAYVNQLAPREDEFGNVDGFIGHVFLDSGLPPFTCEVIEPLPYGLTARVDGRKLLIEGVSTDNGLWESVVRVTANNGVWVDVPEQVQIQVLNRDPHFDKVSLLLHMDGAAGSTVFKDETGKNVSAFGAPSPVLSAAQAKFGGSSLLVNPTGEIIFSGIEADSSADFDFGAADFTVEWWQFWVNQSYPVYQAAFQQGYNIPGAMTLVTGNADGRYHLLLGTGAQVLEESTAGAISAWVHYALVRAGGVFTLWRDGKVSASGGSALTVGVPKKFAIGCYASDSGAKGQVFNGYIDEFRITKGVARYTANFTPPDKPFPNR